MTAATAATVAAAVGGGTTAAEITALIKLLTVLGGNPGMAIPPMEIAFSTPIDVNLTAY
jgi:hypothetical protein